MKLKIKLEYTFEVPDDTTIEDHPWHGLFVVNDRFGVRSKPEIQGSKVTYEKYDKENNLEQSSMEEDGFSMIDFLYNSEDAFMTTEKTTIKLGNNKHDTKCFSHTI